MTYKPALILWDGHGSRNNEGLLRSLERERIFTMFFPPHASHVVQPLDVGIFGGFKSKFSRGLKNRPQEEENIGEYRSRILNVAVDSLIGVATPMNIRSAFRRTGTFPVSWETVCTNRQVGAEPISPLGIRVPITQVHNGADILRILETRRLEKERKERETQERKEKRRIAAEERAQRVGAKRRRKVTTQVTGVVEVEEEREEVRRELSGVCSVLQLLPPEISPSGCPLNQ